MGIARGGRIVGENVDTWILNVRAPAALDASIPAAAVAVARRPLAHRF